MQQRTEFCRSFRFQFIEIGTFMYRITYESDGKRKAKKKKIKSIDYLYVKATKLKSKLSVQFGFERE